MMEQTRSYDTIKERPKPKLKSDFMSYELTHKSFLILPQHRKLLCQHELHQKSQNCRSYRIADCVFNIEAVFKMNSEFLAEKAALESGVRKRRKRKLVQGADTELDTMIDGIFTDAMRLAKERGFFHHEMRCDDNNMTARALMEAKGCHDMLLNLTQDTAAPDNLPTVIFHDQASVDSCPAAPVHTLYRNSTLCNLRMTIKNETFILPARSNFLMSGLPKLKQYAETTRDKFDFIVVDPPWQNKSVKRKYTYSMFTNEELLELPVDQLSSPDAVVAVWVTNKESHQQYLKDHLLPRWKLHFASIWYWCKVTLSGELVTPLYRSGKKPYEAVVIATRKDVSCFKNISASRVFVSTPSLIHSSKPPLKDAVNMYLPDQPRCLELFARNLTADFTSWGNEVLRNQHDDYFEQIDME